MIDIFTILTSAAVVLLLKVAQEAFFRKSSFPLPPGPKGRTLLGNLGDMPRKGEPECLHWAKHKEIYGPISCVNVLGQRIMIISDYRTALSLLDKRSLLYSDRPFLHFSGEMYVVYIYMYMKRRFCC